MPPIPRSSACADESDATDLLVVQITPTRDRYVPMTMAAIDRRLDQITANSTLNAEIAALETGARRRHRLRRGVFKIAAEDEIDGLAQRSAVDLGRSFVEMLHRSGRAAADRWLKQDPDRTPSTIQQNPAQLNALPVQPASGKPSRPDAVRLVPGRQRRVKGADPLLGDVLRGRVQSVQHCRAALKVGAFCCQYLTTAPNPAQQRSWKRCAAFLRPGPQPAKVPQRPSKASALPNIQVFPIGLPAGQNRPYLNAQDERC